MLHYIVASVLLPLKALEGNGLIGIERHGKRNRVYHLLKVKCKPEATDVSTIGNSCAPPVNTNNTDLTRIINNTDTGDKIFQEKKEEWKPQTREELLVIDIAQALEDQKNLAFYLAYTQRFPESLLRRALGEAKEVPAEMIRKSRAALFNHLVHKYGQDYQNHRA